MSAPQNVIAVIFDFDDTLTDESTTKLLDAHGIDSREFWGKLVKQRVDSGWDPPLAYLQLILENVGEGRPFGKLSNNHLRQFGSSLSFYQGIPNLFNDLGAIANEHVISRPSVEFYVVSSGLEEIIRGSAISHYFTRIWGCRFQERNGQICSVTNAVSFTEKTKYLYAINKGTLDLREKPYSVNNYVADADRRIPFGNMIYIGDGLTDVPCFSVVKNFNGNAFGVFDPNKEGSPKKAWETLVAPKRVSTMNSPRYGENDDLGALLRMAFREICMKIDLRLKTALGTEG